MNIIDLKLAQSHIPTLADWHHREWAYLNPGGSVQKRIEKMQGYLGENVTPSMFVAKEAETLLGSAALVQHDMETKMELSPWLASVYVAPDYRNRGIGSALVKQVVNVAQTAGYSTLYLFTPSKENFYKSLGWLTLSLTLSKELFHNEPVTVMQYPLYNQTAR